ncbi:MAG: hypothetical protein V4621_07625 [Pseudomonadota bacterium]
MEDATFTKDEIAILKDLPEPFEHMNGQECVVLETLKPRHVVDIHGSKTINQSYKIDFRGLYCAALPCNLKKKPAPQHAQETDNHAQEVA